MRAPARQDSKPKDRGKEKIRKKRKEKQGKKSQ